MTTDILTPALVVAWLAVVVALTEVAGRIAVRVMGDDPTRAAATAEKPAPVPATADAALLSVG